MTNDTIFDNLVIAPFEQGQKKSGVGQGAYKLEQLLKKLLSDIPDVMTIPPTYKTDTNLQSWGTDYENLYNTLKNLKKYVLLGGDHSIGQSSVASSLKKVEIPGDLIVIWIDAHADTNTYEASISKNFHGMPLAGIMGYEKPWFNFDIILPKDNLLYFGIRDLDEFEKNKIKENDVFYTSKLNDILDKINNIRRKNKKVSFHISWDVDSLDPSIFDSTGCLAENGLQLSDVTNIITYVKDDLIALDIVEYNPFLGNDEKSYENLKECLISIISSSSKIKN